MAQQTLFSLHFVRFFGRLSIGTSLIARALVALVFCETLLLLMSWHVAKAAVQELLNESEDTLFGVGRKDPGLQGIGLPLARYMDLVELSGLLTRAQNPEPEDRRKSHRRMASWISMNSSGALQVGVRASGVQLEV